MFFFFEGMFNILFLSNIYKLENHIFNVLWYLGVMREREGRTLKRKEKVERMEGLGREGLRKCILLHI